MNMEEDVIKCEWQALTDLTHGDDELVLSYLNYVSYYGLTIPFLFRLIIKEFVTKGDRVPTCSELIRHTSEILHLNIRTLY
jgi:hypothetical protein